MAHAAISIIIPNTNSLQIGDILRALKQQVAGRPNCEILVVGTDEAGLIVEDEQVRWLRTDPSACASDKRNLGMRAATGQLLFFLDDDCIPTAGWLQRHLDRHEQGERVVGGAITFGQANYYQLADNLSAFHDLLAFMPEGPRPYLVAANLSIDRSVVECAGEMVAGRNRSEDLDWTVRFRALGYTLYFEPRAIIFHNPARCTFGRVWRHWTDDAQPTLEVRLRYAQWLATPALAKHRWAYLWGAPVIAAWATGRVFAHQQVRWRYGHTLPLVYLTKLAWCWGAFTHFGPGPRPHH